MKRYLIEEAKCGLTRGGFACGPVSGSVVVTVRFNDGSGSRWCTAAECDGIPNFFLLDRDVHDKAVEEDDKTLEWMGTYFTHDFDGVEVGDYFDMFAGFAEDPEKAAIPLIRYIIALLRCAVDEVDGLIEMAVGKYADELDVPISDIEEDYSEE
ncbi:MAG: hypothetical protein IKI84_07945 [Clostridia bacterium]|nr:hypothetical protein [Clostridia bacterium]